MIYSGSAVVDWHNRSGFGTGGQPPLVAVYTAHHTDRPLQNQHLAYSNDRGRTWTTYAHNPVLDIGAADFRDPKVFWHEPTGRWIMVVSLAVQRKLSLYASPDLKQWTHLSDFGPAGSVEGIWECPDLFPLAVDGDPARITWVLLLNVNPGAPAGGSGCQYFVGDFDGTRFTAEPGDALWVDHGADFYAAVTWSDLPESDGRRLALGWMNNWVYGNQLPTSPWRGAMTVPRELTLRDTAAGPRLAQQPAREVERLREGAPLAFSGSFESAAAWLAGQTDLPSLLEVELACEGLPAAARFALELRTGPGEQTSLHVDGRQGRLLLDRTRSGNTSFADSFAAVHAAPWPRGRDAFDARVLVDTCSMEVFAGQGAVVLTDLVFPSPGARQLRLVGEGPLPASVRLTVHTLRNATSRP